jgi:hypothetical protein
LCSTHLILRQHSSFGRVIGYRKESWGTEVRFLAVARNFSLLYSFQTSSGAHLGSYKMGTTHLFTWGQSVQGVKVTTRLHLVLRLRIPGAIPPLSHTSSWWDNFLTLHLILLHLFTLIISAE